MHIRTFIETDYDAFTRLHNIAYYDFAMDADETRYRDNNLPQECRFQRWTAEADGVAVGFAAYHHFVDAFHPHKFGLEMMVDPAFFGQGIGGRLYQTVLDALQPFDPISLASWARADQTCLTGFLERRGFAPDTELLTSALDLTRFDPEPWAHPVPEITERGIQLVSLEALNPRDPSIQRQLYDLWLEVRQDIPIPPGEILSAVSFEYFWSQINIPNLFLAGFLLALDGERMVGTSQLFYSPRPRELRTGLTGVRRAYRRRGIATALKVQSLAFAKGLGYERVVTDNAAVNEGMLAINRALGFKMNPTWIRYLKACRKR